MIMIISRFVKYHNFEIFYVFNYNNANSILKRCFSAFFTKNPVFCCEKILLTQFFSAPSLQNLSKLYLASSDDAQVLSQITITSNGQTKTLDQLQANVDANGFQNGFPVNSDLTISTANSQDTTVNLSGILFVSSPDMAKDPNFLVYVVADQVRTVDRSTNDETTLVLLNVRNTSRAPYYNTRVESINQPSVSFGGTEFE